MDIEALSELCNGFKAVETDIKWKNDLCFNVGGKMILIISLDNVPTTASFKVTDSDFEFLSTLEGFVPAPYLGRYKWIQIDDIDRLSPIQWHSYIHKSYTMIASKLPKKLKEDLNIE